LAQAFVWDGQRALDVLLSRPEVDPSRVGVCGISGGGTQTTWLLAAEDRFTAASPACFITGWREQFAARVGADPEQFPFPANGWGWDQADVLLSFAPKPLLIVAATRDFFPIEGTR
ncbi:MAG TPA: prolyl oligopeptidase family serine peptidase, partial [Candidatus Latescibacteria bacterium]|nr:prolyl oligopeptidase family serine peptidase [Candidatus Latescibacterota bacterium]